MTVRAVCRRPSHNSPGCTIVWTLSLRDFYGLLPDGNGDAASG
jgi:hypothetical protein